MYIDRPAHTRKYSNIYTNKHTAFWCTPPRCDAHPKAMHKLHTNTNTRMQQHAHNPPHTKYIRKCHLSNCFSPSAAPPPPAPISPPDLWVGAEPPRSACSGKQVGWQGRGGSEDVVCGAWRLEKHVHASVGVCDVTNGLESGGWAKSIMGVSHATDANRFTSHICWITHDGITYDWRHRGKHNRLLKTEIGNTHGIHVLYRTQRRVRERSTARRARGEQQWTAGECGCARAGCLLHMAAWCASSHLQRANTRAFTSTHAKHDTWW